MSESEYVYCWKVQAAYSLTDIQRQKLVSSLANISGAVKEYFSWTLVKTPPEEMYPPGPLAQDRCTTRLTGGKGCRYSLDGRSPVLSLKNEKNP